MDIYQISRARMVKNLKGISDQRVLEAMRNVPRHLFVEEALRPQAYENYPLPLGHGQTISQPYVVAIMSELLQAEPGQRILEIGTGSGYQAAILAEMGLEVYSVERLPELYRRAGDLLIRLKYHNIKLKLADGTVGWPEAGPFDRVIVTAGGPSVPEPLLEQLADSGRMVIPVGLTRGGQRLVTIAKEQGQVRMNTEKGSVAFVDLVGSHGW